MQLVFSSLTLRVCFSFLLMWHGDQFISFQLCSFCTPLHRCYTASRHRRTTTSACSQATSTVFFSVRLSDLSFPQIYDTHRNLSPHTGLFLFVCRQPPFSSGIVRLTLNSSYTALQPILALLPLVRRRHRRSRGILLAFDS